MCERWLCNGQRCVDCNDEFKNFFKIGVSLYSTYQEYDWCKYINHSERDVYKQWCVAWWNKQTEVTKVRLREIAKQKYDVLKLCSNEKKYSSRFEYTVPVLEWLITTALNKPPYAPLPYVKRYNELAELAIQMKAKQHQFPDLIRNLLNICLRNLCDEEPGDVTSETNMKEYGKWYYVSSPVSTITLCTELKNTLFSWCTVLDKFHVDIYKHYIKLYLLF